MRRAALRHPKTLTLAALLGIPRTHAVGILECLFDWVADMSPQGNIGKWQNIVIAGAVDWHGDADAFVGALTEAGFLRADPTHRLLINDWHEHCENWVRSKLKGMNLPFLTDLKPPVKEEIKEPIKGGDNPPHPLPPLPISSLPLPSGREARGRALPPDFDLTPEREQYARDKSVANPREAFDTFRDHFTATGKPHKDWDAAWRNWCRREKTFAPRSTPNRADPKPHHSPPLSDADRARVLATERVEAERKAALSAPVSEDAKAKAAAFLKAHTR